MAILVVDDEKNMRWALSRALEKAGYKVLTAADGAEGCALFTRHEPELVLLDLRMPGMDGMEALNRMKAANSGVPVIMITAHGTIENAIEAMKHGADDYLTKPFELETIKAVVAKNLRLAGLSREVEMLRREMQEVRVVGKSPKFMAVMDMVHRVADSAATVLILGETGTGKEVIARSIHHFSPRSGKPFIGVNCGALPENLLESELFGHEKGAFTGAAARKPGRFERAHTGTIFLDEIAELSAPTQVKLLRVLQEKELERVGGTEAIKVDVRVVAATNRDLAELVSRGEFREDLFYRINVIPVHLPPLRERKEDIALLARFFLDKFIQELGRKPISIPPRTIDLLEQYSWPGNIRELENVIERAAILCQGADLSQDLLPNELRHTASVVSMSLPAGGVNLEELERSFIVQALEQTRGNQTQAAKLLGMTRHTLIYRIDKYGIEA